MDFYKYLEIIGLDIPEKYYENPSRETYEEYKKEGGERSWVEFKSPLITNRESIEKQQSYTTRDAFELYKNEGGELSWKKFASICRSFNTEVMDQLIYEARQFNMEYRLGTLRVVVQKRTSPSIDWGASLKRKEELIKQGETPYDKEEAPDGVKWFVYHETDLYCRFYWRKPMVGNYNQTAYRFDPSRGNGTRTFGVLDRLKEHLYEDDLNILKYQSFDTILEAYRANQSSKERNKAS